MRDFIYIPGVCGETDHGECPMIQLLKVTEKAGAQRVTTRP